MTGAFAAVWSNDQQTQTSYVLARQEAARSASQPALVENSPVSDEVPPLPAEKQPNTVTMQVTVEMTLPADIAPGRYRVVQPSGGTFTIVVSPTGTINADPRDLYVMVLADGRRQFYIRIDQRDALSTGTQATATRQRSTRQ